MAQVTSGKVTFSKTVQDHQFEPRRAEVELAFEVEGGEDLEAAIREVGAAARAQALALVGADSTSGRTKAKSARAARFHGRTDLDD